MLEVRNEFWKNKTSWKKSFLDGFSQDENGDAVPWMSYPAIDFLQKNLNQNHEVFEFGCGASTLFFSKKVKKVFSLETNERWLEIVESKFLPLTPTVSSKGRGSCIENVEITLMTDGLTNNSYENFAKNSGQKFDFIVVDSLKRFECAKNSIDALRPGGAIILDDSERKNYKKIFDFFAEKSFRKEDFFGIAPGQLRVKNTTFFWKS